MMEPGKVLDGAAGRRTIVRRRTLPEAADALSTDLHPVLRRVYRGRGITRAEQIDRDLRRLHPAHTLLGIEQAVDLLYAALTERQRIIVVADFDADGATSCALAVTALRAMGAAHVSYVVPNRFTLGYGLTPESVELAAAQRPDLLITVDNGISSVRGVAAAKAHGWRVLITDHHLPGSELPRADAVVNPNLPGDAFPSKHLAGVGVIFYVLAALRARLREERWFSRMGIVEPNLAAHLDLVALGTVADVVPLDDNNRVLVEQGMRRIRAMRCSAGILALLEVAGRSAQRLVAADLGFAVAPRLNAAGRLQDMSLGIECLLCADRTRAREIAQALDGLNRERRQIETKMKQEAVQLIEELPWSEDQELPFGMCLYDARWHQGVIGILAARIKEIYHRPVIAFAPSTQAQGGDEIKGSARSVPGLHIRDTLEGIAARHPDLIARFGGHAMAAGMTLERRNLERFQQAFDEAVRQQLSEDDLRGVLWSDGPLAAEELTLDLAERLGAAGPWGQGFPQPLFDGEFHVLQGRIVGERHLKMLLRHPGGAGMIDAIAFNVGEDFARETPDRIYAAYRLEANEYRGRRAAQLVVEHMAIPLR